MPLIKSGSKQAISTNIREMMHAGHPQKQAIAAAMSTARKYGKAAGGPNMESMVMKGSTIKLGREGMINSSVPGRTDKLPMKVRSGSYILPADIPSALGQGNTMAGGEILKKMFSSGPYGLPTMRGSSRVTQPRLPRMRADGGGEEEDGGDDERVPIIAAGGEYIIHPDVVKDIGHGNMKAGHDVLDKFVLQVRKHHIKTLKKLPGPKR